MIAFTSILGLHFSPLSHDDKAFRSQDVCCMLNSKNCRSKICHDELRNRTVALNPGCQWNCATRCGGLCFNTSVFRQHHTVGRSHYGLLKIFSDSCREYMMHYERNVKIISEL